MLYIIELSTYASKINIRPDIAQNKVFFALENFCSSPVAVMYFMPPAISIIRAMPPATDNINFKTLPARTFKLSIPTFFVTIVIVEAASALFMEIFIIIKKITIIK